MKVLMLSWEYPPHIVGGLGRHVTGLAPALAADGIEIHIVTPLLGGGEHEQSADGRLFVYRAPAPRMSDYEFIPFVQETNKSLETVAREVRRQSGPFDMIHAHDWLVAQSSIAIKQEWKRPLLSTIHAAAG
jgi:glycogen synthase